MKDDKYPKLATREMVAHSLLEPGSDKIECSPINTALKLGLQSQWERYATGAKDLEKAYGTISTETAKAKLALLYQFLNNPRKREPKCYEEACERTVNGRTVLQGKIFFGSIPQKDKEISHQYQLIVKRKAKLSDDEYRDVGFSRRLKQRTVQSTERVYAEAVEPEYQIDLSLSTIKCKSNGRGRVVRSISNGVGVSLTIADNGTIAEIRSLGVVPGDSQYGEPYDIDTKQLPVLDEELLEMLDFFTS